MNIDFHTHGKLAKYLPFSTEYTEWMFNECKNSNLDAICLTEHFNTLGFQDLYNYIWDKSQVDGDTLIFNGVRIFPGMEVDIKENAHILVLGKIEDIIQLNKELEPYKNPGNFLDFSKLIKLLKNYDFIIGGAHPFRNGGGIPKLGKENLSYFDFCDLNGKDLAMDKEETIRKCEDFSKEYSLPLLAGSDTHQALQYGCVWTNFENNGINTFKILGEEILKNNYKINISETYQSQVTSAKILKKALKEIHNLGGDYVKILIEDKNDNCLPQK